MKIIQIDGKALRSFRRRAWKHYPDREYVEALFGKTVEGIHFVSMCYDMSHTATFWSCDNIDWDDAKKTAKEFGLEFLGTVHSHLGNLTCAHPSQADMESAYAERERIYGIVHLYETNKVRRSQARFYQTHEPVKVVIGKA